LGFLPLPLSFSFPLPHPPVEFSRSCLVSEGCLCWRRGVQFPFGDGRSPSVSSLSFSCGCCPSSTVSPKRKAPPFSARHFQYSPVSSLCVDALEPRLRRRWHGSLPMPSAFFRFSVKRIPVAPVIRVGGAAAYHDRLPDNSGLVFLQADVLARSRSWPYSTIRSSRHFVDVCFFVLDSRLLILIRIAR